jgi:hypothetical protein
VARALRAIARADDLQPRPHAGTERIRPVEPARPDRPLVLAEEDQHAGLVRLEREETEKADQRDDLDENA